MPLPLITPQQATALIAEGAKLIDIRDTDEYAREHIALAHSVPLDSLPGALQAQAGETVIFHCSPVRERRTTPRVWYRRPLPRGHTSLKVAFRAGNRPGC